MGNENVLKFFLNEDLWNSNKSDFNDTKETVAKNNLRLYKKIW